MKKSKLQVLEIAKVNLRYNFLPLILLSIIVLILTPVLFGTTNLDSKSSAVPLEMLISIIGIITLVPIFQPEQDSEINDIISSKYVDSVYVYLIRVAYSVIGIIVLVMIFSLFMLLRGCDITPPLVFGTIADAMFLGSIGLLTSAVTNNLPVSFMAPLLYYVMNLTMQSKFRNFNLFAMMAGNFEPNVYLLTAGAVFIAFAVSAKRVITKRH